MQATRSLASLPKSFCQKGTMVRGRHLALGWVLRMTRNSKVVHEMMLSFHQTPPYHIHKIEADFLIRKMTSILPPREPYLDPIIHAQAWGTWMGASRTILAGCLTTSCSSLASLLGLVARKCTRQWTNGMLPANLLQRTLMDPSRLQTPPEL